LTWLSPRHLSPVWLSSVSCSRSSNRTGRFPASGSRKRRTPNQVRHVTPPATSEHNLGVPRLVVNPRVLCCFLRWSLTEVPSLHRSYPASQVLRTSPPPHAARPISHELPVDPDCDHRWGFPCCVWSPLPTCHRHYPGRSDGACSLVLSIVSGLPCEKVRSAPAIIFSGPAQRSLTLWPARSPSRLTTLSIESSDSFVASAAVSIATGWNEPVPGRELHPLKSSAFPRRTFSPVTARGSHGFGSNPKAALTTQPHLLHDFGAVFPRAPSSTHNSWHNGVTSHNSEEET
jgi:hypothetical protein